MDKNIEYRDWHVKISTMSVQHIALTNVAAKIPQPICIHSYTTSDSIDLWRNAL